MINWFDFPKLSNNPEWEHEFLKGNTNFREYKKHEFSRIFKWNTNLYEFYKKHEFSRTFT